MENGFEEIIKEIRLKIESLSDWEKEYLKN